MKSKSAFLEILVRKISKAGRHHVARLPAYPSLPPLLATDGRPACDGLSRPRAGRRRNLSFSLAGLATIIAVCVSLATAAAAVREVGPIGLTVANLNRELAFYTNTLPFELVSISEASGPGQNALLGLPETSLRVALLKLGDEQITLTEHLINPGRAIPADSRSFDHWFQHIAIVVSDMDAAYARLRAKNVKHVSTAPQTLPAWNTNAAGIKAFYFLDPDNHVLELISFPKGKGDPKWQAVANSATTPFLGIDHTAIVVSDTEASLAFYRDVLGLRVAGTGENYGPEQEHLNQVFGARLRITSLRAERGPGIEFLEYIAPPGGRSLPAGASAADLIFWKTQLAVDDVPGLVGALRKSRAHFVSRSGVEADSEIVRDPDGHALLLGPFRLRTESAQR